jgi:hypothetical protein
MCIIYPVVNDPKTSSTGKLRKSQKKIKIKNTISQLVSRITSNLTKTEKIKKINVI